MAILTAGPTRSLAAALVATTLATPLALATLAPVAARADAISDGIAALPGEVEDVRIAGSWTEGDKSGVYRVVISRSSGATVTARLFVQWLAYGGDGLPKVDSTLEITDLAAAGIDIVDYTADLEEDGLSMFIDTLSPSAGDQLYELFITSRTEYRFGPASN